MGEFAQLKRTRETIKIGTCEDMYYLRWEHRELVRPIHGNVDPADPALTLRFRLPFPDEDSVDPGAYTDHSRHILMPGYSPKWLAEAKPGLLQIHHPSGLLVNLPCHHGHRLPEGVKAFWNGKAHHLALVQVKWDAASQRLLPVVGCVFCHDKWVAEWENVLPYITDEGLHKRLKAYAGEQ